MRTLMLAMALGATCVSSLAQGTINFSNFGPGLNAPVFDTDGVTRLAGAAFMADLYWAPGTVTDSSMLEALGAPTVFSAQPGYFFGGSRTIWGAAGGSTITAQVRVWDTASGSSWASAMAGFTFYTRVGESILFQVRLADPNGFPPEIPTTMTGLGGNSWNTIGWIPEPSTLALTSLGIGATVVFNRRRHRARVDLHHGCQN